MHRRSLIEVQTMKFQERLSNPNRLVPRGRTEKLVIAVDFENSCENGLWNGVDRIQFCQIGGSKFAILSERSDDTKENVYIK